MYLRAFALSRDNGGHGFANNTPNFSGARAVSLITTVGDSHGRLPQHMFAATVFLMGAHTFAPVNRRAVPAGSGRTRVIQSVVSLERIQSDLRSVDWKPLQTDPAWRNPCLLTSLITAVSVQQSVAAGAWPLFGLGPLLVLPHVDSALLLLAVPQLATTRAAAPRPTPR